MWRIVDCGFWILNGRGRRFFIFALRSSIYYPRSSIYDLRSSISHLRPVGQDGLAEAGGSGVHPPIRQGFGRAEREDDGEDDGDGAHGVKRKSGRLSVVSCRSEKKFEQALRLVEPTARREATKGDKWRDRRAPLWPRSSTAKNRGKERVVAERKAPS